MNKRLVNNCQLLTDRDIEKKQKRLLTDQNRVSTLYQSGLWLKVNVIATLKRSKRTIQNWESLLIGCVPDFANMYQGERKPITDYHRWCLQRLSNFQNKSKPYKAEADLISFIERNDFSLNKYIESRGKL